MKNPPEWKTKGLPGYIMPMWSAKLYAMQTRKNRFMRDYTSLIANEVIHFCPHGKILDVGTGAGAIPINIVKQAPEINATGVDLSFAFIQLAEDRAKAENVIDRVTFRVAHSADLPFDDESFDLALSSFSIHEWKLLKTGVEELKRVVKFGGQIWLYDAIALISQEQKALLKQEYGWFNARFVQMVSKKCGKVWLDLENHLRNQNIRFQTQQVPPVLQKIVIER